MDRLDEIVKRTKQHCFTWTEDYILRFLAQEASNALVIVESGTYMGASAFCMLSAAPHNAHMWCIDKFMVAGTEFVTRQALYPWIQAGRCELIVGDSDRGGGMLQHMKGKVDVAFVDNGHGEHDLLRDIRNLKPLLKPKGVMLGHDFDVPHNDVARGVIQSGIKFDVPVARLWRHINEG